MAEDTKPVIGIADLFDADGDVGKGFIGMTYKEQMDVWKDVEKKDPVFTTYSAKERDDVFHDLMQHVRKSREKAGVPQATGTEAAPLDPAQPEGSVQVVDPPPSPYESIVKAREGQNTPILDMAGRAAVHTADMGPGLVSLGARGLAGIARAGGLPGADSLPTDDTLEKAGHPVENLLTGGKGFPPQEPGKAILQHIVDAAVGSAVGAGVVSKLLPALQAGIPLTQQAISAAQMAIKGATASEAAKMVGLPSWVQVAADLVAGGMQPGDVRKVLTSIKNRPSVSKYVLDNHVKGVSQAGEEAFGGPSAIERAQTPPGTVPPTAAAHTATLEQSVEDIKAPVADATQARAIAESQATRASEQLSEAQQVTKDVAAQTASTTNTSLAARRALYAQKEELLKVTAANNQMLDRAFSEAEDTSSRLAPELAQAGEDAPQVSRGLIRQAGEQGKRFYDNAYKFFTDRSKKVYGDLYAKHHIEAPAGPLLDRIQKYEEDMKGALRERYEPSSYMHEVQKHIAGLADDMNMEEATLGLQAIHDIRSSILEDLRHSPQGLPRNKYTKQLLREINGYIEEVGKDFPDAIADMGFANDWYRTEVKRFTGGPGEAAIKKNPMTGDPLYLPEVIGNRLFAEGPQTGKFVDKQARNLDFFKTFMDDIDATLARAKANFDLELIAQTQAARDGVIDVARAKFYDTAMSSGTYNSKAAGLWLKKHDALIKARPEMERLFGDAQAAHRTILDVQAEAQGLLAAEQGYLGQFQKQAELSSLQEPASHSALDTARAQEQAVRTTAESAKEAAALAKGQEAQALKDYADTFGSRNAAQHALHEANAAEVLGATPSDIVHQIEAMSDKGERAYAYTKWIRKAGNDPEVKQALLYEKWKNFVGESGVADPTKAIEFIEDNAPFLKLHYPQYYADIKTVQHGFERVAKVQGERGARMWKQTGIEGGAIIAAQILGFGHWPALVGVSLALETKRGISHMRRVGALQEIYTNPAATHTLAAAMRSSNKTRAAAAAWSVLVRSGVLTAGEDE